MRVKRTIAVFVVAAAALLSACTPIRTETSGFLACVRWHESHDTYDVVSADGLYHGGYQFLQSTWDNTAAHAGATDLIGVPPEQASPFNQDRMAQALYDWQGAGPWNGSGC